MFRLFEKIKNNQVYIIAEMSANHGGTLDNALEIVKKASNAGADCIKIQSYTADSLTIDCNSPEFRINTGLWDGYSLYELYEKACTPYDWVEPIMEECKKNKVDFLSTPFDTYSTDYLEDKGVEAYKIASFELVDIPFIRYVAKKAKPMILSCGMASVSEIQDAIDACKEVGNNQVVLLKCCSEYPSPPEDMKLLNIPNMRDRFKLPVGLSDHSLGSLGAVVGVSLGACVVEKHVKLDDVRSEDSDFSMTIDEFGKMVQDIKKASCMLKGPDYNLTDGEKSGLRFRRSVFAIKDIHIGDKFSTDNIKSIRPNTGIPPKYLDQLIGKISKREISYGEPICMEDLD